MPEALQDFNHNQPVYTVSEVSQAIKRVLEDHFGIIRLRGEISGWRGAHSSGHGYFTIKDQNAVINAVCWKGVLGKLSQKPEDGLEVIVTGRISAYGGKYQIVVESLEPAGLGALMALLEKRKKQLEAEGLFDPKRKKLIPYLPRTIGVITSPTGAVIRDILHRLTDRFPVHVLVWPVAVQGEGAAEQVAEAIAGFNALATKPDVIIVARGGGSIEDLWAFNEEIVVRAVAASTIPLISAVGHETDTTLIDYVSDRRAPTPTAAAEMAVPVITELRRGVEELGMRLNLVAVRLFEDTTQRIDDLGERLQIALPHMLTRKIQQLSVLAAALQPRVLTAEIKNLLERITQLHNRAQLSAMRLIETRGDKIKHVAELLESVNYTKVLERGFALVKDAKGKLVTSSKDAAKEKELELTFKDGKVIVRP